MSAQDMRDVLGLNADVARPPPYKKQKAHEKRPLEKGIAREVSALMGERAPPISMIQVQPKYKQRPRRAHKATPWEFAPFTNQAREDGLVLHHWARKKQPPPKLKHAESAEENGGSVQPEGNTQLGEPTEKPYQFAKYNVRVEAPEYTDELYNAQLQDPDWTREETAYLVDVVKDFGQKWAVVVDRYEYQPPPKTEDGSEAQTAKARTMEDLKARYYTVCAKVLAHKTPISAMNSSEYNLYSTLSNFSKVQEESRKALLEGHLYRSQVEVDEETVLLAELQRIMVNQQQLENERREIRERLEYPVTTTTTTSTTTSSSSGAGATTPGTSSTQFNTSAALGQLFQQLLQADRAKKDRKFKNADAYASGNGNGPNSGRADAANPSSAHSALHSTHRASDSINANSARKATGGTNARDSIGSTSAADHHPHHSTSSGRPLPPQLESRYFITHHDRLSSGVSFASDKLHKARTAKSTIQTERIAAVLAHLKIPDVIPLPSQAVVEQFDLLMKKVEDLLSLRKLAEKEEQEIRVRGQERALRAEREREKSGGAAAAAATAAAAAPSEKDKDKDGAAAASTPAPASGTGTGTAAAAAAADGAAAPTTTATTPAPDQKGTKRSASVLSTASQQSSSKRQKN